MSGPAPSASGACARVVEMFRARGRPLLPVPPAAAPAGAPVPEGAQVAALFWRADALAGVRYFVVVEHAGRRDTLPFEARPGPGAATGARP